MAEILETVCENPTDTEQCSNTLQEDIVSREQKIAGGLEAVSERIKGKLDWRGYIGQAPFLSLGVAAGLGMLAGRMIMPEPPTTMEKISDIVQEATGARIGNYISARRQKTILSSLGGLALTMGMGLAKSAIKQALIGGAKRFAASEPEPPLSAES
jgi:hypothetical protein